MSQCPNVPMSHFMSHQWDIRFRCPGVPVFGGHNSKLFKRWGVTTGNGKRCSPSQYECFNLHTDNEKQDYRNQVQPFGGITGPTFLMRLRVILNDLRVTI